MFRVGGQITLRHASKLFRDDQAALFDCMGGIVSRPLPPSILVEREALEATLGMAVRKHRVKAFQGGLLVHGYPETGIYYSFPTVLHHR